MAEFHGSNNGSRRGGENPYKEGDDEQKEPLAIRQFTLLNKYTASLWTWLGALILIFTCLFHIVAFSTNGWVQVTTYKAAGLKHVREIGLWMQCDRGLGVGCQYHNINDISDAFRATQAFAVLSFICMFVSVAVTSLYVLTNAKEKDPRLVLIAAISRCLTVLFLLLTISIFGARWAEPKYVGPEYMGVLEYSYGLEAFCFVLEVAGSGFMLFELMQLINLMDDM